MMLIDPQNNPLLLEELKRVESHKPFPPIDNLRFQLPAPSKKPASDEEWKEALKNAKAQLEHQRIRYVLSALKRCVGF